MPKKAPTHKIKDLLSKELEMRTHNGYEERRKNDPALARSKKIRSSARWRRVRMRILKKNPLCVDPLGHHKEDGIVELGTQVHHVKGLTDYPELAFVLENLVPICTYCHARIEKMERANRSTEHYFEHKLH